jgi:hypothetical protein
MYAMPWKILPISSGENARPWNSAAWLALPGSDAETTVMIAI